MAGSINAETLERLGAASVAADLGRTGLTQVSIEQVLRWNLEVIVTINPNFFDAVWRDPLWQGVAAAREFCPRAYHRTPADAQLDALLVSAERRRP